MTNIVLSPFPQTAAVGGLDPNMSGLSTDALLTYCQTQLSGLDGEVNGDIKQQETQLRERQAVQQAQTALQQFGTAGPQNGDDFKKCLDGIDKAIDGLPPGDPMRATLYNYEAKITAQYGYANKPQVSIGSNLQPVVSQHTLSNPPKDGDWQGSIDELGNIGDNIKSNAEIQMLQLQDLVSQRQQAVQMAMGMLGKEDQTLESQAKAIGG